MSLIHISWCVICLRQPVVSPRPEWAELFEGYWHWMGGSTGANPPAPHGMCPEPSQLHHAVSSVVAPLECYKALWMISAQATRWPPSRDYSSLNEGARRRVRSKRCRRRRRVTLLRSSILRKEEPIGKADTLINSGWETTLWERHVQNWGQGQGREDSQKDPSLFKT